MKTFIPYMDSGPLPIYVGYAPNEKAFHREMKRLGCENPPPYTLSSGTTHILRKNGALTTCIVCAKRRDGVDMEAMIGLLVHEAVHVWQVVLESMDEDDPSPEFEAYTVQHIAQWLVRHALELG